MGGRKLYELLESFMLEHQIKMGRDALFDLLSDHKLLVRRRSRVKTTNSYHWFRKYPNLIRSFVPSKPNQLWVSDITYWKTDGGVFYISLITDAFSHKIVGYQLSTTLAATASIEALKMALNALSQKAIELIHHSDRGAQYCCFEYVKLLRDRQIQISMTENGDPLENAIAERINGIIKDEYLECYTVQNMEQANELLNSVIQLYNEERPHLSLGNKMPNQIHQTQQKTQKLWKNYYLKKDFNVNQS